MPSSSPRQPQAVLRVRDLREAVRYYSEGLGFHLESRDERAGVARVVGPGGVPLILAGEGADLGAWSGVKQPGAGAWVYLQREDVHALAAELAGRGIAGEGPVEPYPGFRYLLIPDPDLYQVVFWEPLPVPDVQVLEIYRSGPTRLQEALNGLTEADLDLSWSPGKWTIRQIVHHLVDSDLVTFHVLRMALAFSGMVIHTQHRDPDDWALGLRYAQQPVEASVTLLAAARAWVLSTLDHLPDGLDRCVVRPSGYRSEVRQLLRQVGGHALHHIGQIHETRRRHGR